MKLRNKFNMKMKKIRLREEEKLMINVFHDRIIDWQGNSGIEEENERQKFAFHLLFSKLTDVSIV